jgi:hypothetical protein
VRGGGLTDADERGDIADAQLSRFERIQDPHPRRIPEHPECLRQRLDGTRTQ